MQILAGVDAIGYSHKPGGCEYNGIKNRCRENHGWRDEKEIAYLVGNRGHAMLPGRFNGEVKGKNCKGMQLFPLDFDDGASYEAITDRCREYDLSFLFSYHTFSSSAEIEKFRLVFAMPFEITDLFIVKAIILILQKIFPEADRMCKDPARVFNGGKELIEFHEGARLSPVNLRYALHRSLDDGKHYAEQLNSFSRNSGIFHDGKSLLFGTMEEIPMFFGENTEDPPYIIHFAADSGNPRIFFAERLRVIPNLHRGSTTPVKLSDLDLRVGQCRLLSDFESGIPLNHSQKFGIMTNLIVISGGQKRFMETIRKYYPESAVKWERDLNQQMELLAARIGSVVHYCRPYTPIQKAKIERWFRTLRDCWMSSLDMRELLYSSVVNSDAHNKTMNRDTTSGFAMHRINIARKYFTSQRKKGEKALIL